MDAASLEDRSIADFGKQWQAYPRNTGRYASVEYFFDIVQPFLKPADIDGAVAIDVGSGSGRIVSMLICAGARQVHAVEPSSAFDVLRQNTAEWSNNITYHKIRGDKIQPDLQADLVVSIGVLHHIPEPHPTVRAMFEALRPGGRCVVWVYAREGNRLLLIVLEPLRWVTNRLNHRVLELVSRGVVHGARAYSWICKFLPLPMHRYMTSVFRSVDPEVQFLIVYDQLNPAYAKYYRRMEAIALLKDAGFVDVQVRFRRGYSWVISGTKAPRQQPR